jgi:hypothetical protein
MLKIHLFFLFLFLTTRAFCQSNEQIMNEVEDELTPGSDIFSDFNEDLESAQVFEDERFYRYGRFFSVNLGGGFTTFTGNRGNAYEDNHPTFHLSINYFLDFKKAISMGLEFSKHTMILDTVVNGYPDQGRLGAVVTDFTRVFVGYKYYLDTSDLGTAITYSNPHFIGRLEYWYQSTKFIDQESLPTDKGGGIGTGLGLGLEFPIELKESYISVEALYHVVNFYDKYTQDFRQIPNDPESTYGHEDLSGNVLSLIFTYNFTW